MKRRECLLLAAGMAVAHAGAAGAADGETSLKDAVAAFNEKAGRDEVGRTQPKLTEDEVVAAIRGWIRSKAEVDDPTFAAYQKIADTGKLPAGAEFDFITKWTGYRGFDFDVWWVDLHLRTAPNSGYNFRIRDQKLASRPAPPQAAPAARIGKVLSK